MPRKTKWSEGWITGFMAAVVLMRCGNEEQWQTLRDEYLTARGLLPEATE